MLGIVLHILKIIGIILLILLALILLVILIVLLVPVRYTFRGQKDEEGPPRGNILLTWLLRILKVEIDINSHGVIYSVRAAGFTLTGNRPEKDKDEGKNPKEKEDRSHGQTGEKTKEKEESPASETEADQAHGDENPTGATARDPAGSTGEDAETGQAYAEDAAKAESGTELSNPVSEVETSQEETADLVPVEEEVRPVEKNKNENKPVTPLLEWIDRFLQKIENGEDFLDEKADQIHALTGKAEELHLDVCLPFTLDLVKRILIHILPQKVEGDLDFGFDDGYRMGQITGFAATLYPLYGNHLRVTPHFEKKILAGHLQGKGRLRLGFVVWQLVRTLLNGDMRRLIVKIVKKEL